MAARFHLHPDTFRRLNQLGPAAPLVHRRRYVVARGLVGERLIGGVSMGPSTDAYVVVQPARAFGRPEVVAALQAAAAWVQRRHPTGHRIVFEDLSLPGGGCMPPHIEHRGGREVDAGLYLRGETDVRRLRRATAPTLDATRTWAFLHVLLAGGCVERVLLDRRLHPPLRAAAARAGADAAQIQAVFGQGRRGRGVVRHAAGHDNHAHIRFRARCAPSPPPDDIDDPPSVDDAGADGLPPPAAPTATAPPAVTE